jgi:hypothetical protein
VVVKAIRAAALAALAARAVACSKGPRARPDSAKAPDAPAAAVGASDCPKTGHWSPCQVRKRLEQSGVAPRDTTLADLPAVGPTPITYAVATSALAVYLFADTAARSRAARTLDTTKFVPPSRGLTMRHEATTIENDNLLALLFTQRDQQRERVADALMAGPPQP